MTKYSTLANELYPYLLPKLQKAGGRNGGGAGTPGVPPSTLSQLSDVQLTALADGDFLAYEASISKWVNVDAPAGSGGSTYTAGWGVNIASLVISVDVPEITDLNSGLALTGVSGTQKIAINLQSPAGLVANSSGLAIDDNLAGNGLSISGKIMSVQALSTGGLDVDATGVFIKLRQATDGYSGLYTSAEGLTLRDDVAGAGLAWGSGNRILGVGAGNGITVGVDSVAVNQDYNFNWTGTHTFADNVTLNANGTFNTGVFTFNTDPQLNANLDFTGTARSITAAATLTISPTGNLHLDPTANITMPNAQVYRSTEINDLPTGIDGVNIFNRADFSPLYVQMTIGAIKSDELHVRIFTADETRINRAEEYWSKSFGIVQEDFSLPGVDVTVDVWFEDAPAMPGANLFAANDWLLMRSINWGTGLITSKVWFQVVGGKLDQETTAVEGVDRQQWCLVRRAGGWTTTSAANKVKAGNVMLDAGQVGQGWVHLSALAKDGGPYIQFGKMTSISTTPLHSNYVRIGNLKNTVGVSVDTWGMAAGNNLGLDPNLGEFKGFVIEGEAGLSLYNTDLHIYNGATRVLGLTNTNGLTLAHDVDGLTDTRRHIAWYDDLSSTASVPRSMIGSYVFDNGGVTTRQMELFVTTAATSGASIVAIRALEPSASRDADLILRSRDTLSTGAIGSAIEIFANEVQIQQRLLVGGEVDETSSIAKLHVVETTSATNQLAGLVVEQKSTGDAVLHWRLTTPNVYYSMGIDNSDGDKLKISASTSLGTSDFFVYNPVTGLVTISGLEGEGGGGGGTYTAGSGITITGTVIAVNSTVVRTTQAIIAGPGLTGGGALTGDINLSVNAGSGLELVSGVPGAAVRISLALNSGLSLTGGLNIPTVFAGDGLVLTAGILDVVASSTGGLEANANSILVKLPSLSGLITDGNGLRVIRRNNSTTDSGIHIESGGLVLADAVAGAGLEWTTATERILQIACGGGLEFSGPYDDALLRVKLPADAGILRDATGIFLDPALAGAGLSYVPGVLSVGAGDGITVGTNTITIKLRTVSPGSGLRVDADGLAIQRRGSLGLTSGLGMDTVNGVFLADQVAGAGLEWTSSGDRVLQIALGSGLEFSDGTDAATLRIKLPTNPGLERDSTGLFVSTTLAGAGMTMNASRQLNVIAANTSITVASDDIRVNTAHAFTWTATHQFDVDIQVNANLDFLGARSITSSSTNALVLAAGGNLIFDSGGDLARSVEFSDLVTGISGFRMWDRGANEVQLSITAMKMDELYARVFVADEVRIDRGEEYWSKSFGVIESDFNLPLDEGTVNVWFENSPGLASANLFSVGDWLLLRSIDWGVGLAVYKVWFTVVALVTAGSVDGYRQRWTIRRESGGTFDLRIKKGGVMLDAGQIGQGWIHLSALSQDGGPFVQIGDYTSVVGDIPQFTNRVRMGNLSGVAGISGTFWGFAAGNNLALDASLGQFSGFTVGKGIGTPVSDYDGMRLFNSDIAMYESGTKIVSLNQDSGLTFLFGLGAPDDRRSILWATDVENPVTVSASFARVAAYQGGAGDAAFLNLNANSETEFSLLSLSASGSNGFAGIDVGNSVINFTAGDTGSARGRARLEDTNRMGIGMPTGIALDSTLHIYEDTSATGTSAGVTIEQRSTGDALLHLLLSDPATGVEVQRIVMGIDNSDGDKFKLGTVAGFASGTMLSIDPAAGNTGIGTTAPAQKLHVLDTSGGANANLVFGGSVTSGYTLSLLLDDSGAKIGHNSVTRDLEFQTASITRLTVEGGGDVGIGTTDPTYLLHVYGNGAVGARPGSILTVENAADSAYANLRAQNDVGAFFQFTAWGSAFAGSDLGVTRAGKGMMIWGGAATDMVLGTSLAGNLIFSTNATRRMTISATDGYVGINAPTPSAPLEVTADNLEAVRSTGYGSNAGVLSGRRALGTSASPTQVTANSTLLFVGAQGYTSSGWPANGSFSAYMRMYTTQAHTSASKGTAISFYVTPDFSATNLLALQLHQAGDVLAPGVYAATVTSVPNMTVTSDGKMQRTTHANSSLRYKEQVQSLSEYEYSGLFAKLNPVSYLLKGGDGKKRIGLIAEEVEAAGGGDFIQYDEQGRPDVLMYDRLIVVLIAEIRKLQRRMLEFEGSL